MIETERDVLRERRLRSMTRAIFAEDNRNVASLIQPVIMVAAEFGVRTAAFPATEFLAHEAFG